jgi:hypothetical protein
MTYGVVYGLYDPRTGELRYIGQTKQTLKKRLMAHLRQSNIARGHRSAHWVQSLGALPIICELGVAETKDDLDRLETSLIAAYREKGVRLTNHADGGGGTSGFTHRKETRDRMSLARAGRPKSEETKARMSESGKNDPQRVAACGRLGSSLAGKPKSTEHRKKLSRALKGRPGRKISSETRTRMSAAAKFREAAKREKVNG